MVTLDFSICIRYISLQTSTNVLTLDGGGQDDGAMAQASHHFFRPLFEPPTSDGIAWCIQASNLCDDDRHRVIHILRTMLRLPDASLHEPVSSDVFTPRPTAPRQAVAAGRERRMPS